LWGVRLATHDLRAKAAAGSGSRFARDSGWHVTSKKNRQSTFWGRFFAGRPSRTFILWTRRTLLVWWFFLLVLGGPDFLRRFNDIQATTVPDTNRSAAIQRLLVDAAVELIALPGMIFAMLGYGIALDRTSAVTGGPWFRLWWSPAAKGKHPATRVRADLRRD